MNLPVIKQILQKVSDETMRFMRGKYVCDEVGNGVNCKEYLLCDKAVVGKRAEITPNSILADDVTWAILPHVHGQYGN